MTIIYFTTVPFPDGGMASGNRILHLARALVKNGCNVMVCAPFSDSGRKEVMPIDGVVFRSLCLRNGLLATRLSFYLLFPYLFYRIVRATKDSECVLYSYQPNLWLMFCAQIIAWITRCPLCREGTEFPYTMLRHAVAWKQWVEVNCILKWCKGVVAITDNLAKYYRKKLANGNVIHIPMTVDCDRFDGEHRPSPFDFKYIAYTGAMNRDGGGVDILVKAFGIVVKKCEDIHLVLIGRGTDQLKRELLALVDKADASRIHFLFGGNIPSADMPRYIKNAKLLAMLPLPTKQQEGCFPTKLGEYLASGVPTVVSKVGIPPKYLTDGVNIRFISPDNPSETADVMLEMLENYDAALKISLEGKTYARRIFHYENFGPQLRDFFQRVLTQR